MYSGPSTRAVRSGTAARGTGEGTATATGAGTGEAPGFGPGASALGASGVSGDCIKNVWYAMRSPAISRAAMIARFSIRPVSPSRLMPLSRACQRTGRRIITTRMEGMTSREPSQRQPASPDDSTAGPRLTPVLGAARLKPAGGGQERPQQQLVAPHNPAGDARSAAHAPALRLAVAS